MVTVRIGNCQVEVRGPAKRLSVYYGDDGKPRYLTVVGSDGEAWSIASDGTELGVKPAMAVVHKARGRFVRRG